MKKKTPGNRLRAKKWMKRGKNNTIIRTNRTPEIREKILENLNSGKCLTFSHAAEAAGVSRRSAYEWRRADEYFANEIEAALSGPAADNLERVLKDHALNGVEEPVIFQGQLQYVMIPVKRVKIVKGKTITYLTYEPKMENGEPVPLTVTKFDHGLGIRMLDRMRPISKGTLGDEIISLAEELKAARERAEIKE